MNHFLSLLLSFIEPGCSHLVVTDIVVSSSSPPEPPSYTSYSCAPHYHPVVGRAGRGKRGSRSRRKGPIRSGRPGQRRTWGASYRSGKQEINNLFINQSAHHPKLRYLHSPFKTKNHASTLPNKSTCTHHHKIK